jgi:uncharacterized phosphosugar-binding protein
MMLEYAEKAIKQIEKIVSTQAGNIHKAAEWFAEAIIQDKIIHTFGTGHSQMIGLELFTRASGLANVNAIMDDLVMPVSGARRGASIERVSGLSDILWEKYAIQPGDILVVISNSGRNAMPLEMAMRASKESIPVIAITSLEQSQQYPSRHESGKKLYELANLVIDNCVPSGDGLMRIAHSLAGPASSLSGIFIVNAIATEAMKIAAGKGCKLPVYFSQNIDGFSNEELYLRYEKRIKHL